MKIMSDIGVTLLLALLPVEFGSAQIAPPAFARHAIESATIISDGVCSNSTIGLSYRLPEGMKSEDAAVIWQGSSVGPEARYFLYEYKEANRIAMLCGAANEGGRVVMTAIAVSAIQSEGPHALEKIVQGMGQELGTQSSSSLQETINGQVFERADGKREVDLGTRGRGQLWVSFYAAQVNSYVVVWSLLGYSEDEWTRLVGGMKTVKILTPQPVTPSAPPATAASRISRDSIAPDFQAPFAEFLAAWIAAGDQTKTLAFVNPVAYSAPPLIGTYCSGWIQKGESPQRAAKVVAANLMGVPGGFPKNTPPAAIFGAWDRLPPEWISEAANNVATDHFLVARLDVDSLSRIFSDDFAHSDYHAFLQGEIPKASSTYWAVFPVLASDGDIFVIFTLWQKNQGVWSITHIDVVCQ
jgi:hypothetical protein